MDMLKLSFERFTTKHYDSHRRISDSDIQKLKEILRLTPSAVNCQPWHFIIGSSEQAKQRIRPAIADFNWARTDDCSHFIVLCIREVLDGAFLTALTEQEEKDGRFPDEMTKQASDTKRKGFVKKQAEQGDILAWETHQVYIAMASLLYGAASLGIQSTAIEGYSAEKLDEILGLKDQGLRSVAIVSLGYGAKDDANAVRPKSRLPIEQLFTELD